PMAFLLLLPGAILTQFKGMVGAVIAGADEDSINPFTGIIRAVIAVFLIVCTPLIVSYCIDAGNALAEEVVKPERGWVQEKVVTNWAKEQTFNPSPENVNNAILVSGKGTHTSDEGQEQGSGGQQQGHGGSANVIVNVGPLFGQSTGNPAVDAFNQFVSSLFGNQKQQSSSTDQGGGEGKAAGQLEGQVTQEDQLFLSSAMQVGFNALSLGMGETLNMLAAYQLVFMCYLFLMGPIAACFYAWPAGIGGLFKKVFSNWLDAVVVLS